MEKGRVRAHVLPKMKDDEDLNILKELHRFEAGPDLTCCSVILSADPTGGDMLTLPQHAHFFRRDGTEGGHFEEGVTKDDMHYIGYYTLASSLYRLNNPNIKA